MDDEPPLTVCTDKNTREKAMKNVLPSVFRILLGVILGAFILGQFGRLELAFGRALYVQDIFLSVFLILFCIEYRSRLLDRMRKSKLILYLSVFGVWVVFTSIIHFHDNTSQLLTSILYLIRFNVIAFFGMVLYQLIRENVISRLHVHRGIMIGITGIAVAGLFQYIVFPDTRNLVYMGWDDHLFRLISTIFDPGFTGIIIAIGVLLVLQRIFTQNNRSVLAVVSFFILNLSLLLTYSRASYLAFVAGIFYLAWRLNRIGILSVLLLFAIGILFLPRPGGEGVKLLRTASSTARIESVEKAVTGIGLKRVIVGDGWYVKRGEMPTQTRDGVSVPNHSSAPENSYVFVFASLGIVGLVLWARLMYEGVIATGWDTRVMVSLVAVSVHSLFSNTFFHPFVVLLLVTIMAGIVPRAPESSRLRQG